MRVEELVLSFNKSGTKLRILYRNGQNVLWLLYGGVLKEV